MNTLDASPFGNLLRRFRLRKGLSQQRLANQIEVHRNSISLWERGLERPETHGAMLALAQALDLDEEEQSLFFEARFGTASVLSLHNMPFERNPYFTGREELLSYLHYQLLGGKRVAPIQALCGLGGIGKTQTAIEYAYRYQASYHDILWASADSYETLVAAFVELTRCLRLPEKNDKDQNRTIAAVKRWLSTHKGWLLILDNVEDLRLVRQFIPPGRQGTLVITTRRQVTEPVAQAIAVDSISEEEGALFLLRRSGMLSPFGGPGDAPEDEYSRAKSLSQTLGGLPLALDQAAAYIRETTCGLSGYLERYHTWHIELLKRRGNISLDHPESVTTTWKLSLEKIEQALPLAIHVLQFCAFLHPDEIPTALLQEGFVQRASPDDRGEILLLDAALAELGSFSLLRQNPHTGMLTIHRLVQVIVREVLDIPAQRSWIERVVSALHHLFPDTFGILQETFHLWPRCQQFLPQVQACVRLIEQHHIVSREAVQLLRKLGNYLCNRGQLEEAERLLLLSLNMSAQFPEDDRQQTIRNILDLVSVYHFQGRYKQVQTYLEKVIDEQEALSGRMHATIGQAFNYLAWICIEQGAWKEAEGYFQQAFAINTRLLSQPHPDLIHTLVGMATCDVEQERAEKYAQAEFILSQAINDWEHMFGTRHLVRGALQHRLAMLYKAMEKYDQAVELLQCALTSWEETIEANHPYKAYLLSHMASLMLCLGHLAQAEQLASQAVAIAQQVMGPEHLWAALAFETMARVYDEQSKSKEAEKFCQAALAMREKVLHKDHPWIVRLQQYAASLRQRNLLRER